MKDDKLVIGGKEFNSRFILGSGKYSLDLIKAAVENAGAELITVAVRRANTKDSENILDYIPKNITLLPNTSGARTAEEAVRIARLGRELGCGDFVKVEIMRDGGSDGDSGEGRVHRHAVHVSGSEYRKRSGECRCRCGNAAGFPDRIQQGSGYQGVYPDSHR